MNTQEKTPNTLKLIIMTKGITQTSLSRKSGVPYNTISRLCNGDYCQINTHLNTLRRIAHALGLTVMVCFEDLLKQDLQNEDYFL